MAVAALAVLLSAAAIAAASGRQALSPPRRPDGPLPSAAPPPSAPVLRPNFGTGNGGLISLVGGPLVGVLAATTLLVMIVAVGYVFLMIIRAAREAFRRVPLPATRADEGWPEGFAPVPAEVAAALDAGVSDLSDAETDPRRAVIACWVRLEQAAGRAGTPRLPGDAPADFVSRLLTEHRVDRPVLAGFAEVYRRARYATHTVDEPMRQDALAALRQVRAGLGMARPPGSERPGDVPPQVAAPADAADRGVAP